jgi:adenylate cyclase
VAIALGVIVMLAVVGGVGWYLRSNLTPIQADSKSSASAPRLSLVVLPFTNLNGDPAQDYIADVITEELTTSLSRIRGGFVIARSTAFTYKGKSVDVKQIGRELGVRYVLEGSEQHGGNRVRVNAQLIGAETGAHVWADQFDADRSDPLQMQDDIVMRVARALQTQLVTIEAARVARTHATNPDAEDLAMRCEAALIGFPTLVLAEPGFALCERALQIDKDNVRALANLAHKFAWGLVSMRSVDLEADVRRADELASRALQLDPNYYLAHNAKALVLLAQKRHQEALAEAERTLVLNPSYIAAYVGLCSAYFRMGRLEKVLEECDQAIRLGPRDPLLWHSHNWKAAAYFALHQDDQAIEWWQRGLAAAPNFSYMQASLAAVLALNDRDAEARVMLTRYLSNSDTKLRSVARWRVYMKASSDNSVWLAFGDRTIEGLRKAGLPEE